MALVCVRVVVQVVWDWMVRSNSDLSALRITVLADAIVYAGCFWLIIARVRSRGVIGSIFLALCIAVMQFSSTQASNNALAIDLLVLLAVSFEDPRRLCRGYAFALGLSIAFLMLGSMSGLLFMADDVPNGYLVFTYGVNHPNVLGGLLLSEMGALTYAYWQDKKWWIPLSLTIFTAFFAKVFLSSNASAVLLVAIACLSLIGHVWNGKRPGRILHRANVVCMLAVPLVLAVTMIVLTVDYDGHPTFAKLMDSVTHFRPQFANAYLKEKGGLPCLAGPT